MPESKHSFLWDIFPNNNLNLQINVSCICFSSWFLVVENIFNLLFHIREGYLQKSAAVTQFSNTFIPDLHHLFKKDMKIWYLQNLSPDGQPASQVVVGSKQDVERIDLPFEEIEATVSFFSLPWKHITFSLCGCRFNVLMRQNQVRYSFTFHDNITWFWFFSFSPWKSTGGTRSVITVVSTPRWNQVSLDWECGYMECSSLEGRGVSGVFKWAKLSPSLIPFFIPTQYILLLNFLSRLPHPLAPSIPLLLTHPPGNCRRRLCCEEQRHQSGERSEPRRRRPAARPPPWSTGYLVGRTAGGNWKRLAGYLSPARITRLDMCYPRWVTHPPTPEFHIMKLLSW